MGWTSRSDTASGAMRGGELWGEAEFLERLRSRGTSYYDTHPFHGRMHRGELTREQLAGWVANRFCYQRTIPLKDAAILSNCPERDVRRRWIQRIHDHDGRDDSPGGLEAWLLLGEAVGLRRKEIVDERHVVPGVRFACDAYLDFCRRRPWVEAVASSLTELFAPDLMSRRIAAFESNYPWIDREALGYFRGRLTQAPRDSEHGLEIVLSRCRTLAEQEAALSALDFKLDVLWCLLDAIHYHYVVLPASGEASPRGGLGAGAQKAGSGAAVGLSRSAVGGPAVGGAAIRESGL